MTPQKKDFESGQPSSPKDLHDEAYHLAMIRIQVDTDGKEGMYMYICVHITYEYEDGKSIHIHYSLPLFFPSFSRLYPVLSPPLTQRDKAKASGKCVSVDVEVDPAESKHTYV